MDNMLQKFEAFLKAEYKHTVGPTGAHVGPNVHGPDSLFGVAGLERDVISSRVVGNGLAAVLPVIGSNTTTPMFPYITGKTAAAGSQVGSSCQLAPEAGHLKTCIQTAKFGLYQFTTRELEVNTIGRLINAGERVDLRFVNDPLAAQMGRIWLNIPDAGAALQAGRELLMRFVEVGMEFEEILSQQIYVGSGLANEFPGLETLVNTVHYDAITGLLCPALKSDVRDFGDVDVTTSAGAAALVRQLVDMYRQARYNADVMRFGAVDFRFVMRRQVFQVLADIWPCAFMTSGCVPTNSSQSIVVNTDEQLRMRIEMQDMMYLPIDGTRVPVVTDMWMPETDLGENVFSSDIYLLPFTIRGGELALYWETFDYGQAAQQINGIGRVNTIWTDGGRYLTTRLAQVAFCEKFQTKIEPRLILRTPQLAGRLMNVGYSLVEHYRDPNTSSLYYVNGGVSTGYAAPSLYNEWDNIPA